MRYTSLPPTGLGGRQPVRADTSGAFSAPGRQGAYGAANTSSRGMRAWRPGRYSGQSALDFERDIIADRVHDVVRRDGWASTAVDRQVDAIVGAGWTLNCELDARALNLTADQADAISDVIEGEWARYVDDPRKYCHVERRMTGGGVLALAMRHRIMDGEVFAELAYRERRGPFGTAIRIVDPDRVSQPYGAADSVTLRAGVEMDDDGAAIAYHVRSVHEGDAFIAGADSYRWDRMPRETEWGRPLFVHAFEPKREGQLRGEPPLAPILEKLKAVRDYDEVEMQAALVNAVLAAFIESPMDPEVFAAEMGPGINTDAVARYQNFRAGYHGGAATGVEGAEVVMLAPGEKASFLSPAHPNSGHEVFVRTALRNIASAAGVTYEQLTGDYSQVNYSSARAALIEIWRSFTARSKSFSASFVMPWYMAWLEELLTERRPDLIPARSPSWGEAPLAWCGASWIPPGRGWVDPEKEAKAATIRVSGGFSSLRDECAEQGKDWRKVLTQRAREARFAERNGITLPTYTASLGVTPSPAEEPRGSGEETTAERRERLDR